MAAKQSERMNTFAVNIVSRLMKAGAARVHFVGGCVRDHLLGIEPEDFDLEAFGLNYEQIVEALSDFEPNVVGRAFGVVKIGNVDVSIPRRDSKTGIGHKGFEVDCDHTLSPEEAAERRDFTINSIAMTTDGDLIDPFGGRADLEAGILRPTTDAFKEDPLRVLRGMQFVARFGLTPSDSAIEMSRAVIDEFETLSRERLWWEFEKWTRGASPSLGLEFLEKSGWLDVFPALSLMRGVPQSAHWHPEGDVWIHTKYVCDAAATIAVRREFSPEERTILLLAALLHDCGKPSTTTHEDGRIRARGHCRAGVEVASDFLDGIMTPPAITARILPLIDNHLVHTSSKGSPSRRAVMRLARRLEPASIRLWAALCEADLSGRPPLPPRNPCEDWESAAAGLNLSERGPKAILMGRHLLERGVEPGPEMGATLKAAFEAQLDDSFRDLDGALEWLRQAKK